MSKDNGTGNGKFEKSGYRPLNEGYTPNEQRGYVPTAQGGNLPKAPEGSTGESPAAAVPQPAAEKPAGQ
jgi:hypothetical protein